MAFYLETREKIFGASIILILIIIGIIVYFKSCDDFGEITDLRYEIIEQYKEYLKADPTDKYIMMKIGNLYRAMGDLDKAIEYYKKILELDPNDYDALKSRHSIHPYRRLPESL